MVTYHPKDFHPQTQRWSPTRRNLLQTLNLALRLQSQNQHQVTTAMDGHLPCLGWSPTNPTLVTHQKEVHHRLGICNSLTEWINQIIKQGGRGSGRTDNEAKQTSKVLCSIFKAQCHCLSSHSTWSTFTSIPQCNQDHHGPDPHIPPKLIM